jgi:hypothetical protein
MNGVSWPRQKGLFSRVSDSEWLNIGQYFEITQHLQVVRKYLQVIRKYYLLEIGYPICNTII